MRTIWLAVVPVLLAAGLTAQGQQIQTRKKPSSSSGTRAVNQSQYSEGQPQAPAVSVPGYGPPGSSYALPPDGPPMPPGPHAPMGPPPHGVHTVLPDGGPHHGCGCDGGCDGCGGHGRPKHGLLPWLCYRPLKGCEKYPCGPCCRVPLNHYFCGCKEGYTFCVMPPCCGCPRPDIWSKIYSSCHRWPPQQGGCVGAGE